MYILYRLRRSLHQHHPVKGRQSPAQPVLQTDPLVPLHPLLLQEAGEEDHHVTHQGQVQALPFFLPAIAHHGMALTFITSHGALR